MIRNNRSSLLKQESYALELKVRVICVLRCLILELWTYPSTKNVKNQYTTAKEWFTEEKQIMPYFIDIIKTKKKINLIQSLVSVTESTDV